MENVFQTTDVVKRWHARNDFLLPIPLFTASKSSSSGNNFCVRFNASAIRPEYWRKY